jgi:hypothetical protein
LEIGAGVLLLDSLDEVSKEDETRVHDAISTLISDYPKARIVVSCRTADYDKHLEPFSECELLRLTPEAVSKIIRAWFPDSEERADTLRGAISNDDGIAELTQNPLLLSLLCIQFRHDLSLPKRKVELYGRCIDALLREWDAGRGFRRDTSYSMLSDSRKETIFGCVAAGFSDPHISYIFPSKTVRNIVGTCIEKYGIPKEESGNVLKEIESHHGILEKFSSSYFVFSHPSFQEYYIAKRALTERNECRVLKRHIEDEDWAPIIEFAVAMADDPKQMLQTMVKASDLKGIRNFPPAAKRTRHLWLLYRSLAAGAAIETGMRIEIFEHLIDSQFELLRILEEGGVLPLIVLLKEGGLRQAYYYHNKRPTLAEALWSYRKFCNEILLAPIRGYAERVLERTKLVNIDDLSDVSVALSLVAPIASHDPEGVLHFLEEIPKLEGYDFLSKLLEENLTVIRTRYL